ncbi:MAG: GNAT family N-acetyltransferase [Verrucomicrobia bacterium]|nr:GNAT family N-acetyltransferase [Verrucomicrobiota bacterium]
MQSYDLSFFMHSIEGSFFSLAKHSLFGYEVIKLKSSMKNLHLVDVQYLKDLDLILREELPRCVVELGCWDGFLLQHAYKYIKSISPDTPLEVVALLRDKNVIDSVRRKLQDIPHRVAYLGSTDYQHDEPYISIVAFQDEPFIGESQVVLQKHAPGTLRSYFLEKAGLGYFPKAGQCFHYQDTYTLANFEKKIYTARTATPNDLKSLVALEEASWVKGLANSESVIQNRIHKYPEGQILFEIDGEIVGAIYSQRIDTISDALSKQSSTVESLCNPNGAVLQLLSVNILPDRQHEGLASSLLEFCLQLAEVDLGIKEAIGITRCARYPGHGIEEYIRKVQEDGRPEDPVLRMHVGRGAEIRQLVTNYRPEDLQNQGYGVLTYFPLNKRVVHKAQKALAQYSEPIELYETTWKMAGESVKKTLAYDRLWIIFANSNDSHGYKLRELLQEARQYCIFVEFGECFEQKSNELYSVRPDSADDFVLLFSKLEHLSQLAGVLYLWDELANDDNLTPESLEALHKPALMGLTNLANALYLYISPNSCVFWVATYLNLVSSPLEGVVKAIRAEYPELHCSYFTHEISDEFSGHLMEELEMESHEPAVRWKDGERYILRMVRAELPPAQSVSCKPEMSYLVYGAFRLLGLKVADWYVAHGAKNLILIDSWDITPDIEDAKRRFEAQSVRVGLYKVDMRDLSELRKVTSDFPPIDGVIQFAPVINDQLLVQMSWEKYREIYETRVLSSWALHELTKELPLDHFVLFSSVVPDFSFSGKAALAAASSFLDFLSRYRKERKLPSVAIDWGLWSLKSVRFMQLTETRQLKECIVPFEIEHAFKTLERVLHYPRAQVIAAIINWKLVVDNPLFYEI